MCWPDIRLYDKQEEILYSLRDNDETVVPAGNGLGKDFVCGLAAIWFFCSRTPCRIVTSSVDQPQLRGVLWGEIRRFIQSSKIKLPLLVNDLMIRQQMNGVIEPRSYLIGRVTAKGEGLLGHHIERMNDNLPRTLVIFDEASGIDNESYEVSDTWSHRALIIGNPYPCSNFFFKGVKEGTKKSPFGNFYRKVIKITAQDSPNIRLAEAQIEKGQEPTNEILIPGVVDFQTYTKRRELWDKQRQSVGLDATFYEGSEVRLYPPLWLDRAERIQATLKRNRSIRRTLGIDSAEGGDSTVWTVVDMLGIIHQLSLKTPDTSVIVGQTLALMAEFRVVATDVYFDRGGGGKQHADLLRKQGHKVNTVGFGEPASDRSYRRGMKTSQQRRTEDEHRYTYKNRRAEMYGILRDLLDPEFNEAGFGIPKELEDLRNQLQPIPKLYDEEGRMFLPPKDKRSKESTMVTLKQILGRSPDEADSTVLAVYGLFTKTLKPTAGVA
jgi:hypothetical protein